MPSPFASACGTLLLFTFDMLAHFRYIQHYGDNHRAVGSLGCCVHKHNLGTIIQIIINLFYSSVIVIGKRKESFLSQCRATEAGHQHKSR